MIATKEAAVWSVSEMRPRMIRKKRRVKPTARETRRSKKAWRRVSSEPSTEPAEIWRNGRKRVRKSEPMEKKSAVLRSLSTRLRAKLLKPRPYHQLISSTRSILLF